MPRKRTSNEQKRARGTYRADRSRVRAPVVALERWPKPPREFGADEGAAWNRLGAALLPGRSVAACDLVLVGYAARVMARADRALSDESLKLTAITALLRLVSDLLRQLGMSPAARDLVQPLPERERAEDTSRGFDR